YYQTAEGERKSMYVDTSMTVPDPFPPSARFISRGALAIHHDRRELFGFAEIDEVRFHGVARLQPFEIGELDLDDVGFNATEIRCRRFSGRAIARVQRNQAIDGVRNAPGRNLRDEPPERGAGVGGPAADHDEILRDRTGSEPPHAPLKSDRGDVMLPAAVRASADLDARAVGHGNPIRPFPQMIFEQPAEAAWLRDGETARFRARAARHVRD